MITRLSIQGLAIIDSLSIEFSPGFNVITGETGAGKSILIRALGFLMGAKAGAEAIRKGSTQATVSGEFQVPKGHPALEVLEELGVPYRSEDELEGGPYEILIRRTLNPKGRSQSWVNDTVVTSQPLRALGATLVDVFGQHENQRLMDPGSHIYYLDGFLADDKTAALRRVESLGGECLELMHELSETIKTFFSRERNRDYLSFRLEELEKFAPSVEDCEKVTGFSRLAERQGQVRETLVKAAACLEGDGEERALSRGIWESAKYLGVLAALPTSEVSDVAADLTATPSPALPWQALKDRAMTLARELEDLSFDVGKLLSGFEFDEQEVEAAQARLFGYHELFRKHSVREISELMNEYRRLGAELDFLESASANIEAMVARLAEQSEKLVCAAVELTQARKNAAAQVKNRVERELHELAMPGSRLEVEFLPARRMVPDLNLGIFGEKISSDWKRVHQALGGVGERGAEKGQFLLASNPGEPLLPLSRVASGGELSRIMLAMKKSLAADADTCVLVFDEIDSGISGRVADVVGQKMRELASSFQVICISHLPQVAVYADVHFLVKKGQKESESESARGSSRTESTIVRLSREESAREIARLLSGAEVSSPSLANALSLIERARAGKSEKNTRTAKPKASSARKPKLPAKPSPRSPHARS